MTLETLFIALALLLVLEGFALALFPGALRRALEALEMLGEERQRTAGFVMIGLGLFLLWILG